MSVEVPGADFHANAQPGRVRSPLPIPMYSFTPANIGARTCEVHDHEEPIMPRQPKPDDAADKEIRNLQDDTADPGDLDPSAPHDRGSVQNGRWLSGME